MVDDLRILGGSGGGRGTWLLCLVNLFVVGGGGGAGGGEKE